MKNNNSALSRGQKSKFPAMALGLSLAIAAPAIAGWDAEDGPGGTTTVLSGATLDLGGDDLGSDGGTLDVQAGGTFIHTGEVDNWENGSHFIFDGVGSINEMKFNGGDAASTITVGGTLTVSEGFIGKKGIVEMTIGTTGTFIVEGYASAGARFSIDSADYDGGGFDGGHGGYASFLDIVGDGRFLLASNSTLTAGHGNEIRGNGVVDAYTVTAGTGADTGYSVYTATAVPEPTSMSLLALGGLALLRRRRRA